MNTQGMQRGLMAKNMPNIKFIELISNTISKEFEMTYTITQKDNTYTINFNNHTITISSEEAKQLQNKSPYSLDKFILNQLTEQGLKYDPNRSGYTKYVHQIFEPWQLN